MTPKPDLLDQIAPLIPRPEHPLEGFHRLRQRKHRAQRLRAGALGIAVVLIGALLAASVIRSEPQTGRDPTETPSPAVGSTDTFTMARGWIAYTSDDGIWAVDPDDPSARIRVVNAATSTGDPIGWSRDGTRLLVADRETGSGCQQIDPCGLFVIPAPGGSRMLVGPFNDDLFDGGSFSPDGSMVAYGHVPEGQPPRTEICIESSEGGRCDVVLRQRAFLESASILSQPTFSRDGGQIAFLEGAADSNFRLWLIAVDGSNRSLVADLEDITPRRSWILHLAWSPKDDRLVFHVVRSTGRNQDLVSDLEPPYGSGSIWGNVTSTIYTIRSDGSGLVAIGEGSYPTWSPDGSRIAFVRSGVLHTMAADGSDVRSLGVEVQGSIAWNPVAS